MNYLGDFADNSVVDVYFTTHDKDGAAVAPSSAFENTDISIYKNGSATQKTSVNGLTMTSPFDGLVGLHLLQIDTNNDTGDIGFWAIGSEYSVVLTPDETVDGEAVIKVIGSFSLERAGGAIQLAKDIPTNAEFILRSLPAADYTIVTDLGVVQTGDNYAIVNGVHGLVSIQDDIDEILLDTAEIGIAGAGLTNINLPNQTMDITGSITGNLSGSVGSVTALSAAAVDSILDEAVEGALTLRHITKILLAYMAGRSTGGGTVTIAFKDQANTKSRIVMTVNADGDRSNVVVDGV